MSIFNFNQGASDFPEEYKWLNTENKLNLQDLKGHIIILDFWTYCCINCIHLLPELKYLEEKYKNKPVVFIGVHSSKFYNENDEENIQSAIWRYEIKHPIIVDKDHKIRNSYHVNSWPTVIVIDQNGKITFRNSGEKQRAALDEIISFLLEKAQKDKSLVKKKIEISIPSSQIKPKTSLSFPGKISYSDNELLISDSNNNRILVTKLEENKVKVIHEIGSGKCGLVDGDFKAAKFNKPQGIAKLGDKIYVADTKNHSIREIDLNKKYVKTI